MKLRFTKMHGAGNDFVVVDGVRQAIHLEPAQWRRLADRQRGIGADQILLVEPAQTPGVDFRYRIFNADGGEVEQCGNGARCFARFVHDQGLTDRRTIRVETLSGIIEPALQDDGRVCVDMGPPAFDPGSIPFDAQGLVPRTVGHDTLWPLALDGVVRWISVVSMGNPHAVQLVDDVAAAPVSDEGPRIEHSARFPRRVNVGYLQVVSRGQARLRVWERGAGETLACGTGACAAVVTGIRRELLDAQVDVHTRGGRLTIHWSGDRVSLTGPAVTVFEGEIDLPAAPLLDPA
ncbi:MAG: diaminopimelate epimerase [Burkholderiaceae bacterium]|nr:diaminopimelate epimerase [Burkholderiaceae bacterium]